MEEHLEDFLVAKWNNTELAKDFDIYEENRLKAQQYPTDTGRIDILAVSKDKRQPILHSGPTNGALRGRVEFCRSRRILGSTSAHPRNL